MKVIAIGDIHGDLNRFKIILAKTGLINDDDTWSGGDSILVQTGDMVDRTPSDQKMFAAFEFLMGLQEDASSKGGRVVRLLGNHEQMILEHNLYYHNKDLDHHHLPEDSGEPIFSMIRNDILDGRIKGAFSHHGWLFVHGGLRTRLRYELLGRMDILPGDIELIADRIDQALLDSVTSGDYDHSIFHVGRVRYGSHESGGVFWTDFEKELCLSDFAGNIRQIVGHTKMLANNMSEDLQIFDIDTGICKAYGGILSFLEVKRQKLIFWSAENESSEWKEKVFITKMKTQKP